MVSTLEKYIIIVTVVTSVDTDSTGGLINECLVSGSTGSAEIAAGVVGGCSLGRTNCCGRDIIIVIVFDFEYDDVTTRWAISTSLA